MSEIEENPWLEIPAEDYESHMAAIGQSAALRELFSEIYTDRKPRRLAILGCTTGSDMRQVDPSATELIVGVDINSRYLDIARERLGALGPTLQLVHGDVLQVELPAAAFDLIHVALLFEYVDPLELFRRIHRWLSCDGCCSVVTQAPAAGVSAVTETGYQTLQRLAERMSLRSADELASLAEQAGFRLVQHRTVGLPSGKSFESSIFEKARVGGQPLP